jgi:very-short-patch-repair endonuclease
MTATQERSPPIPIPTFPLTGKETLDREGDEQEMMLGREKAPVARRQVVRQNFCLRIPPSPSRGRLGWGWGWGWGWGNFSGDEAPCKMKGQTNEKILTPKLQRRLRRNPTDAEQLLWNCLRRKQIGNFKFRRQHPFGDYVIDIVCLEAMLAVEVDGGQHSEMRDQDAARTKHLTEAGFKLLRFWNNDVLRDLDAVKESIWIALLERSPHPCPSP